MGQGLRGLRRSTRGGGGREGGQGRVEATLKEVEERREAWEEERKNEEGEGYPGGEGVEGEGHRCKRGKSWRREGEGRKEVVVSSTRQRTAKRKKGSSVSRSRSKGWEECLQGEKYYTPLSRLTSPEPQKSRWKRSMGRKGNEGRRADLVSLLP